MRYVFVDACMQCAYVCIIYSANYSVCHTYNVVYFVMYMYGRVVCVCILVCCGTSIPCAMYSYSTYVRIHMHLPTHHSRCMSTIQLKVRPHDLQLCTETSTGVDSTGQFQWGDLVTLE